MKKRLAVSEPISEAESVTIFEARSGVGYTKTAISAKPLLDSVVNPVSGPFLGFSVDRGRHILALACLFEGPRPAKGKTPCMLNLDETPIPRAFARITGYIYH